MKRSLLVLLLASSVAHAVEPGQLVSPSGVRQLIKDKGAHAAVHTLFGTPQWDTLIVGIASGDSSWLQIAEEIWPGSDAGSASELQDAVAWALPHAPVRVLAMTKRSF